MSSLELKLVTNKADWEQFILSQPTANFLQSWNWGKFHQGLNKQVFYLGLLVDEKQIGAALVIKEEAKRGNYLTIAGGPIIDWTKEQLPVLKQLFAHLKTLADKENCSFVRIRPQAIKSPEVSEIAQTLNLRLSPMHLAADLTLQLKLHPSNEELLKKMRKNTRYEIRKVEREKIEVKQSTNPDDIKEFHQHQLYLAKKHDFVPFSYDYLYQQFLSFIENDQVVLFHAYQQDKLLSSAFIIFYNREAVYHYGISTPDNQRLPGSYACQWAAILEAKRRGCTHYNFWGVAPKDQKSHRFAGVSLFKRGFGGEEVQYLPAHDLPVSWQYQLTRSFELARKKVRKL